ncbi:hypothetical protein GN956_G14193 [Arapaima gigas]
MVTARHRTILCWTTEEVAALSPPSVSLTICEALAPSLGCTMEFYHNLSLGRRLLSTWQPGTAIKMVGSSRSVAQVNVRDGAAGDIVQIPPPSVAALIELLTST